MPQSPWAGRQLPWDEAARLRALADYGILDTPREADFDDIVGLAALIFEAPIAVVNLIADGRQWFKAETGIGVNELPIEVSICAHAMLETDMLIVPDTTVDPRFACNPLVAIDDGLRFYAGALLKTADGLPLGTVCVLDRVARPDGVTALQQMTLEVLGRQVMTQLELRRLLRRNEDDARRLSASEMLGRMALDAAELGAWEAILDEGLVRGDAWARRLVGHDDDAEIGFDHYLALVHPDDRVRFAESVAAAVGAGSAGRLDIDYRLRPRGSDRPRWLRSRAQMLVPADEPRRLVGTVRDVSAEKAAEEHRALLTDELQHRVKNTLSVVQGIVSQSLRSVETPREASAAIAGRLVTLAQAHDVLTQTSWTAAPIASVIAGALVAHVPDPGRLTVAGPPLDLKPRAALALSMALHELFTNALKYGSLSNETGRLSLTWTIGDVEPRSLHLCWRETGGPTVAAPARRGFGSRLTGDSLATDLGGSGVVDYAPDGLRWTLATTVAAVSED